jgi:hypothetical protein
MLTEFAFTPSIFDEGAHEDKEVWIEQLRELGRNMFPHVSTWPVIVSDLYGGSWSQTAQKCIESIKDHKAKALCLGIVQNMKKALVTRPACGNWPGDDASWKSEAIATSEVEPIERIVTCSQSTHASPQFRNVRTLDEVGEGGFWKGIRADASPRMIVADQVELLRKICIHSDWLALISKDIYGGGNDETDFATSLISRALNRPKEFGTTDFELHTEGPREFKDESDYEKRKLGRIRAITGRVAATLSGRQAIELFVWPRLLDRYLIAGTYTQTKDGERRKRARWGVLLTHIARIPDEKKLDFYTDWNLLSQESLLRWHQKYVEETAPNKPTPVPISLNL